MVDSRLESMNHLGDDFQISLDIPPLWHLPLVDGSNKGLNLSKFEYSFNSGQEYI